jgi:hypothetical protein
MTNAAGSQSRLISGLIQLVITVYFIGASLSFLYFNWTYARDNGFMKWLLLGQIVPTAKAVVWPYFVFAAPHEVASKTPWPASSKATYRVQCPTDLQTQGVPASRAQAICDCLTNGLEREFGLEEYGAMMNAQPRRDGSPVDRRLYDVTQSCMTSR